MESVPCGAAEKDARSPAAPILGTDSVSKQAEQPCQEYVLQSDRVTYRIRPRNEKDSVLLPVGEPVRFRLQKDKIVLRVEDLDGTDPRGKELAYIVVSMSPRSDSTAADATPVRLNHLQ
jgi:hypothetical protein